MFRRIYQASVHGLIVVLICASYAGSLYQMTVGPL